MITEIAKMKTDGERALWRSVFAAIYAANINHPERAILASHHATIAVQDLREFAAANPGDDADLVLR